MRTCIWCLKFAGITFNKISHILPQGLGSKEICKDVCDSCNEFFGEKSGKYSPSIDVALKEMFILSKYQSAGTILSLQNNIGIEKTKELCGKYIGKNDIQKLNRNTEFLIIHETNGKMGYEITDTFWHHVHKPYTLTNRLKRGLFKVAFETAYNKKILESKNKPFIDPYYHYVRDFVRDDKGNLKMYYLEKKFGLELTYPDLTVKPKVLLHNIEENYLKFEILGHTFALSIGKSNFTEHYFLRKYIGEKQLLKPRVINSFLDIDIFNKIYKE